MQPPSRIMGAFHPSGTDPPEGREGATFRAYGVRGSMPAAYPQFMGIGGNTSCYTLRTPANSLIFLDAGTGMLAAGFHELQQPPEQTIVAFSHTHADHTMGLGFSKLRWWCDEEGGPGSRTALWGPVGLLEALATFYDGRHNWPVVVGPTEDGDGMPCFDPALTRELAGGERLRVDASCEVTVQPGNHPVELGVLLYRFELSDGDRKASMVYATDHELDHVHPNSPHADPAALAEAWVDLARGADLIVADGQWNQHEYEQGVWDTDVRGFGHAYVEQLVRLASRAGAKRLLITHHGRHPDEELEVRESQAQTLAMSLGTDLVVEMCREGAEVILL